MLTPDEIYRLAQKAGGWEETTSYVYQGYIGSLVIDTERHLRDKEGKAKNVSFSVIAGREEASAIIGEVRQTEEQRFCELYDSIIAKYSDDLTKRIEQARLNGLIEARDLLSK